MWLLCHLFDTCTLISFRRQKVACALFLCATLRKACTTLRHLSIYHVKYKAKLDRAPMYPNLFNSVEIQIKPRFHFTCSAIMSRCYFFTDRGRSHITAEKTLQLRKWVRHSQREIPGESNQTRRGGKESFWGKHMTLMTSHDDFFFFNFTFKTSRNSHKTLPFLRILHG